MDRKSFDEVVAAIEAAFGDIVYPGDDALLHPDCMDDMDIAAFYGGTTWQAIPDETVGFEYAALSFVSAEGFRYLLPAYMTRSLRHFDDGDIGVESTVWALDPNRAGPALRAFQLSKYTLLSGAQRAAIAAFLEVIATHPSYLGEDARTALVGHWRPAD